MKDFLVDLLWNFPNVSYMFDGWNMAKAQLNGNCANASSSTTQTKSTHRRPHVLVCVSEISGHFFFFKPVQSLGWPACKSKYISFSDFFYSVADINVQVNIIWCLLWLSLNAEWCCRFYCYFIIRNDVWAHILRTPLTWCMYIRWSSHLISICGIMMMTG